MHPEFDVLVALVLDKIGSYFNFSIPGISIMKRQFKWKVSA